MKEDEEDGGRVERGEGEFGSKTRPGPIIITSHDYSTMTDHKP